MQHVLRTVALSSTYIPMQEKHNSKEQMNGANATNA
jgi:hypothetical protein